MLINLNYIFKILNNFTNKKHWELKFALLLPLVILFFSFPPYYKLVPEYYDCWGAILTQKELPFTNHHYLPQSHEAKTQFRLVVPLIAKIFHLSIVGILILQAILGIVALFMVVKIFSAILRDNTSALIFTLSFAFIWAGKSAFIEYRGLLDGYAFFFLIAAIYFRNPLVIFLAISLASWADERGLIASSLVVLYWMWNDEKPLRWINKRTIAIILSWLCYFIIRYFLSKKYGLTTESDGANLSVFKNQIENFTISVWSGLEGFWALILLSLCVLIKKRETLFLSAVSFAILIIIAVAMSVFDITRSMAYLFPVMFISVSTLRNHLTIEQLRKLSLIILALCFIYPTYESHGKGNIDLMLPLPFELVKMFYSS